MTDENEQREAMTDRAPTVIEQAEQNPAAAREIAAARLAVTIVSSLNAALRTRGWQAKRLAAELGIGESAVSQVLSGDGNVRVATIGRYARALGYQARMVLEPVDPRVPPMATTAGRRRRTIARSEIQHPARVPDGEWHVISTADGDVWAAQARTTHVGPDRMVLETAYTRLSASGDDSTTSTDDTVTIGGGA